MKNFIIFTMLIVFAFVSCSDDPSNPISPDDTTAPDAVTDLFVNFSTGSSVSLFFTAPGDDGMLGRVTSYEVRYSTTIINSANYIFATSFLSVNRPHVGGVDDTIVVTGLAPETKYYFALKAVDESSNWSQISNIDSATTLLGGNWTVYNTENSGLLSNKVIDIQFDGGVKYIATLNGVSTYDNTNWNIIYESQTISIDTTTIIIGVDTIVTMDTTYLNTPYFAQTIAIESSTKTWLGIQNLGVALIEGTSTVYYSPDDTTVSIATTRDILIDQNKLWIGTLSTGLHSFALDGSDVWTQYDVPISSSVPGNGKGIINCLEADVNNAIWAGLEISGVTVLDNTVFTNYSAEQNFTTYGQVWDISSHGSQILFGTDDGAFLFENNSWTNFVAVDSGVPDDVVISTVIDNQGTFWFGTRFGLASFDGSQWTNYTTSNSFLPDNWINTLNVDMFGNIWIGTNNGLVRFSK